MKYLAPSGLGKSRFVKNGTSPHLTDFHPFGADDSIRFYLESPHKADELMQLINIKDQNLNRSLIINHKRTKFVF
jgi:hypothetical protein